jgi:dTDP-4-dehydrorhamnose reductase
MKILITGGSGSLGYFLNSELHPSYTILSLYNNASSPDKEIPSQKVDITDTVLLEKVFSDFNPDVIVHSAAISSPQAADQLPPKTVYNINVNATATLAKLASHYNAKLIYISTDLVYAGYRGSMLNENAKLVPLSLYAETKLMGEEKVKSLSDNYLILRISLQYGFTPHPEKSHFHQMYLSLKKGHPVKLFTDQFRTPLSFPETASIIRKLVEKEITNEIINVGGPRRLSRYQLGEMLADAAGLNKNLLLPVSLNDFPDLPQVADVSMDTSKLNSYGIKQKSTRSAITDILTNSFSLTT